MKTQIAKVQIKNKANISEWVDVQRPKPRMCKTCKQYVARNGSAYCVICADKYKNDLRISL